MNRLFLTALLLCVVSTYAMSPARADRYHHRTYIADPGCNIIFPCEGVKASPRGEAVSKSLGGFGSAQKIYTPRRERRRPMSDNGAVVAHPAGCPSRAFCGCGAAVRLFGSPIRSLWLAANWFRFPRASPAPGMAAVRRHHVMVLEVDLGGGVWQVFDANSGRHMTRVHARSISGYVIVNPRGGAA